MTDGTITRIDSSVTVVADDPAKVAAIVKHADAASENAGYLGVQSSAHKAMADDAPHRTVAMTRTADATETAAAAIAAGYSNRDACILFAAALAGNVAETARMTAKDLVKEAADMVAALNTHFPLP